MHVSSYFPLNGEDGLDSTTRAVGIKVCSEVGWKWNYGTKIRSGRRYCVVSEERCAAAERPDLITSLHTSAGLMFVTQQNHRCCLKKVQLSRHNS